MFYQTIIEFSAPPSRVWEILTQAEYTQQYMYGCAVLSNWKVGHPITWDGPNESGEIITYVKGEILAIDPGREVTFSMLDPNQGLEDIPSNYVHLTYTLEEVGEVTKLHIRAGDFSTVANGAQRYEDTVKGWEMVIPVMINLLPPSPPPTK